VKETGELGKDQPAQRVEPHRLERDGAANGARCRVFGRRAGWNFESVAANDVDGGSACADGMIAVRSTATTTAATRRGLNRNARRAECTVCRLVPKVAKIASVPSEIAERDVESAWGINLLRS
jgi:hypothetical protein